MELTIEEASAMAQWVVYLTDSVTEGVELVTAHRSRLPQHSDLLRDLTAREFVGQPIAAVSMVTHLLLDTQRPFHDCYNLRQLVRRVLAT